MNTSVSSTPNQREAHVGPVRARSIRTKSELEYWLMTIISQPAKELPGSIRNALVSNLE